MTFREKLQKEHPERIREDAWGGCEQCPHDYGYEDYEKRPCIVDDNEGCISCEKCWNREIPETEPTKPNYNISLVDLIERAGTKKDISLLIHINGDDTTISVYPCPDPSEKKGNPVAGAYKLLVQADLRDENSLVCAVSNAADLLKEALE